MEENKTNNLVAKHARTFNKSHVMKDRKKAKKKGYQKHKGSRYEDSSIDEVSTSVAIGNFFNSKVDKVKYTRAVKDVKSGKYKVGKASQVYNLDPKLIQKLLDENFVVVKSDGDGEGTVDVKFPDRQSAQAHANKENKKNPKSHKAMHKKHAPDVNKEETMKEGFHPEGKPMQAHLRWDIMTGSTPKQLSDKYGMTVNQAKNQILMAAKKDGFHVYLTGKDDGEGYRDTWMQVAQMIANHGSATYKRNVMKHAPEMKIRDSGKEFELADRADVTKMPKKPFTFRKAKFYAYNIFDELEQISKGKTLWSPEVKEEKKGLWDRIHAKRKRGEKPAKPGDKDYPKTLDVGEATVHINLDDTPSARQDKVTKILKRHETKGNIKHAGSTDKGELFDVKKPAMLAGINRELKSVGGGYQLGEETVQEISSKLKDRYRTKARADVDKQYKKGDMAAMNRDSKGVKQADRRVMTRRTGVQRSLPKDGPAKKGQMVPTRNEGLEQARDNVGADKCWDGYKAKGTKMKNGKEVPDCKKEENTLESAQDRLDRRAAKHGLGKPNKAADDYVSKMKAKHGEDGLAKMRAQNDAARKARMSKEDANDRANEMGALKQKHKQERDSEKRRSTSIKRKYNQEQVTEELSALEKRKYANLKRRSKSGDRTAKSQLAKFEKEMEKQIAMSKGSAKKASKTSDYKKGVADPHSGAGYSGKASEKGSDDHIIMQLRKAQDVDGKFDIKATPTGKTVRLPKQLIDKLLKMHDSMQKPDQKRKLRIMITKELRKRAK